MTVDADQDSKKRLFRVNDLIWVFFFVGLGIFLIFAVMSLFETWRASTLSRQFFGL